MTGSLTGARRLEARMNDLNAAAVAPLRRTGVAKEASLRASFPTHGGYQDHEPWTMTDAWRRPRSAGRDGVTHSRKYLPAGGLQATP